MRAYSELYLNDAMNCLGEAADYAKHDCRVEIDDFFDMFLASGIASQFEKGSPKFIGGVSGCELAIEVLSRCGLLTYREAPQPEPVYDRSAEYWCGWIVAYCQWARARRFVEVLEYIPAQTVLAMYPVFHEMEEDRFVEAFDQAVLDRSGVNVQVSVYRKRRQLTQKELAFRSGVNLRTLQQYELGSKDIAKASGATVAALARALSCTVEDLLSQ